MKKRSILVTVLAVVLACVLSVGGTLAFLTAKDDEVVNTFEFAKNMKVSLSETTPTTGLGEAKADPSTTGKGVDYKNVVPGQTLPKVPHIAAKTDVSSYVFVKVSGATEKLHPVAISTGWTPVVDGTAAKHFNGVYYKEVNINDKDLTTEVIKGEIYYNLGDIFTEVQVGDEDLLGIKGASYTGTVTLPQIKIEVYEIQKAGFANAEAALDETDFATTTPGA